MPTNKKGYIKEYTNKLLRRQRANRGFRCCSCFNTTKLEFAHKEKTNISGPGRGKLARARDIMENFEKYTCLCHKCHVLYDRERRQ